jgi:hypothetical protein
MNFNITETERTDLITNAGIIKSSARAYTALEQYTLYNLYNRIYGTNKAPNGCGSCLRSTISGLKKALQIAEGV